MYVRKYYTPGSYEWMPHDDEDESGNCPASCT